ncbi:MAG: NRDE family protein [Bacteroidota bacterium]|nr:NRDE family protein [Bacteroidota bacterium]MDX5431067.1 NRDE family protein [Bacteroidota bacterium]MDX5469821.1 NRDE family protein [Bacteroidota bacterium]
MCTLSYIPTSKGYFFTSNRDEKQNRPAASLPDFHPYGEQTLWFPKDGLAGGTWFASSGNRHLCLLNGAFQSHQRNPKGYLKSRGIVLLDAFAHLHLQDFAERYSLLGIEPFTLVEAFSGSAPLRELRWDGKRSAYREISPEKPTLWSSVTLYPEEQRARRSRWFDAFLEQNPQPDWEDILHFHRFTGEGDSRHSLVMEGPGTLRTLSITSIFHHAKTPEFYHLDLVNTIESKGHVLQAI